MGVVENASKFIKESPIKWPKAGCGPVSGSTQDMVVDGSCNLWVSGPAFNQIAKYSISNEATTFYDMGKGSVPQGLTMDKSGHLWVALQGLGEVVQFNIKNFKVQARVDVKLYHHKYGLDQTINTEPHGLGLAPDGSIWFTGKQTNSVGRIESWDSAYRVKHYPLLTPNAVPICIAADTHWKDKNATAGKGERFMWCTELHGNAIARISLDGVVTEFPIPTANSRPITIVKDPQDKAMWFTEETGGKVGRIDMMGKITEFSVPLAQRESILAGLTFDESQNLWVQQYVIPPRCGTCIGNDYIVKFQSSLLTATPNDITDVPVTFYKAPSQITLMNRILPVSDSIWFTEMGADKLGCIDINSDAE